MVATGEKNVVEFVVQIGKPVVEGFDGFVEQLVVEIAGAIALVADLFQGACECAGGIGEVDRLFVESSFVCGNESFQRIERFAAGIMSFHQSATLPILPIAISHFIHDAVERCDSAADFVGADLGGKLSGASAVGLHQQVLRGSKFGSVFDGGFESCAHVGVSDEWPDAGGRLGTDAGKSGQGRCGGRIGFFQAKSDEFIDLIREENVMLHEKAELIER